MIKRRHCRCGFTLIEILCVVAIVGTLCALLFPSLGAARRAVARARTRTQFSHWTIAAESFRSEYGNYPVFAASQLVNDGAGTVEHPFHDLLAGRHRDGTSLTPGQPAALQNRRAVTFHVFAPDEFDATNLLQDASGHLAIAVLVDRDLDGIIKAGTDYTALPAVDGMTPDEADFPPEGVRAGIAFYSAAPGATPQKPDFVCSWK